MTTPQNLSVIVSYLQSKIAIRPEIGLILGSGLGDLAHQISDPVIIPYREIPHFPQSTVPGHSGQFVIGLLGGRAVICMQGRFHYYEGHEPNQIVLPVRAMQAMGVHSLIVTNAAGGIGDYLRRGDLMLIEDHINLMGINPLRGKNDDTLGPRFPDMTAAYDPGLREKAETAAAELGIAIKKGVYAALSGPTYETPAEIRYLKTIGADAVGMSTVPEVIVANHGGMKVLGISCITNMAAGISKEKLNHQEVIETANNVRDNFINLIIGVVAKI